MPRANRLILDRGYYHVFTRGNDRKQIFRKDADYQVFISIVKRYLKEVLLAITNYCLMPNHLHLLIFTERGDDLSIFMKNILQVYANYHRKEYNSVGFLYQNRFKSLLINNDSYLLECSRYIERNPLRGKLVSNIFDWPWNSFSYYAKGDTNGIITKENPAFQSLGSLLKDRRTSYINYVLQERPYDEILDKVFELK
jgi:putative transposase